MTKVNQTGDVQSLNTFGLAYSVNNAFTRAGTETASASSSTSVTATGATSHASDDAKGAMIIANTSSTWAGTTLYGVVQTNTSGTSPVYTVDRWYTMVGAASGSSPSTSGPFVITPGMAPFWYVALMSETASVTATMLGSSMGTEYSSNGLARQIITSITRTAGSAVTYAVTLSTTFTYTAATASAVGRCALVNSLVVNKDFAYFIDQINSGVAATVSANGDTLQISYSVTVG